MVTSGKTAPMFTATNVGFQAQEVTTGGVREPSIRWGARIASTAIVGGTGHPRRRLAGARPAAPSTDLRGIAMVASTEARQRNTHSRGCTHARRPGDHLDHAPAT